MQLSEFRQKLPLIISAGFAAFSVYFCMYAFRKPFAVGVFEGIELWGINYKIILIVSQVLGYTLSKFIGIKVISGIKHDKRPFLILLFIGLAELALLGFAVVAAPYNFIFLFLNGLPLGMIWGLVFSYLEGRSVTEVLATILSASFILSSGVTKSIGKYLILELGVNEFWMPFYTGLIFLPPLILSVWWLEKIPAPSTGDIKLRKERLPMTAADRKALFSGIFPSLLALVVMFFFITAFRDYRDNFSAEIWQETGYGNNAEVFIQTEFFVAFGSLLVLALFVFIKDNMKAVKAMLLVMIGGMLVLALSTFAFQAHLIKSPLIWMTLVGLGGYIAYIPLGSALFERVVASFEYKSNAGFLIYIADAVGYGGSVLILFYKEFFFKSLSALNFFIKFSYITVAVGIAGLVFAYFYFDFKYKNTIKN